MGTKEPGAQNWNVSKSKSKLWTKEEVTGLMYIKMYHIVFAYTRSVFGRWHACVVYLGRR